jgi:hypothetical protein
MKKICLVLVSLIIATAASFAQDKKKIQVKKSRFSHSKQVIRSSDSAKLSNRKIYPWKDGQRATPTGHVATPSNGSQYAALKKDTTTGRRKEKE